MGACACIRDKNPLLNEELISSESQGREIIIRKFAAKKILRAFRRYKAKKSDIPIMNSEIQEFTSKSTNLNSPIQLVNVKLI